MKRSFIIIGLLVIIAAFTRPVDDSKTFTRLHALEGTWMMKTAKGFTGEEWIKIDKNYLQNRGFMIKGADTIVTETVALRNEKHGIFYTSTVTGENNQQPVAFQLTRSADNLFVFENAAHDYPKRITYHLISKDSLHAWIDDGSDEASKRKSFSYHRVNNL